MKYEPYVKEDVIRRARIEDSEIKWCKWNDLKEQYSGRKELLKTIKERYPETKIEVEQDFEYFDAKDACVWIDPLDGTNNFVKGNFDCVTTVIGLSIKGESRIGIVHNEFFNVNRDFSILAPRTFFATIEHGAYILEGIDDSISDSHFKRTAKYLQPFNSDQQDN